MPRGPRPTAARQHRESILQPTQNLVRGHQAGKRGGQFDRQWDAVQPATELRYGGSVLLSQLKAGRN